ncbi:DUF4386 domain-containing protein [Microlunatus ginsengisoli]|jgi:hypothetical protein|uniref:DUF4386 domain-containing protein n=1 Tax=Microlunatus ginsengisoli TaxID=363863 RepID=A0ABP7ANX1_9ACTN
MMSTTQTLRRASVTAGIGLALMAVLAAFGVFGAVSALITPGDAAQTAQDIAASPSLFRLGIACLIVVVILDVIVAAALFTVFAPVNRMVSAMAAGFRVAYAAVYLVAISQLVIALQLLADPDQALRAIDAYTTIWHVGLILFGVHLLLLGYLAFRSGFMPKIFGILLVIAGLGYLADGFGTVLVPDYAISIGAFTFVGEVALIFWLLISGSRNDFRHGDTHHRDELDPDPTVTAPVG